MSRSGTRTLCQDFLLNTSQIIFEENGTRWLRTGDIGSITEEGYFKLTGRLKRILWSIGADNTPSRVYPMEIEGVLCRHSAVDKCAVVGRANGKRGYLVITYVTLKSQNVKIYVEKELRCLCEKELKDISCPSEYHFVESLPTTEQERLIPRHWRSGLMVGSKSEAHA